MTNRQRNEDRARNPLKVDPLMLIMGLAIVGLLALIIYLLLSQLMTPDTITPSDEPSTLYLPLCVSIMGLGFALFGLYIAFTRKTFSIFKGRAYGDMLEGNYHLVGTGAVVTGLSLVAAGILFIVEMFAAYPDALDMMSTGDFNQIIPPATNSPAGIIVAVSLLVLGFIVGHIIQAIEK